MYTLILSAIAGVLAEYYKQPILLTREGLVSEATEIWVGMSHLAGTGQKEYTVSALANKYGHEIANIIMDAFISLEYDPLDNYLITNPLSRYVYKYGITPTKITISAIAAIAVELTYYEYSHEIKEQIYKITSYPYSDKIKEQFNNVTDYCAQQILDAKLIYAVDSGDRLQTIKLIYEGANIECLTSNPTFFSELVFASLGKGAHVRPLLREAAKEGYDFFNLILETRTVDLDRAAEYMYGFDHNPYDCYQKNSYFKKLYNEGAKMNSTILNRIIWLYDMGAVLFLEQKQDPFFLSELETNEQLKSIHRSLHLDLLVRSRDLTIQEKEAHKIKELIDLGVDVDAKYGYHDGPLRSAFDACNVVAAKMLVEAGATYLSTIGQSWCNEIYVYLEELKATGKYLEFHE